MQRMSEVLEIIATTVDDAVNIRLGGGQRIELVSALSEGGVTPSYGLIKQVLAAVKIPVNVMIRPHTNSFIYSESDFQCMLADIEQVKNLGANGIVLGMLDEEGDVALEQLNKALAHSQGLEVTFHRAVDKSADPLVAIKQLAKTGIKRVLSSGGPGTAKDNLDRLREFRDILDAAGKTLLVGRGITLENCGQILTATMAHELHVGNDVRRDKSPTAPVEQESVAKMAAAYRRAMAQRES